MDRDVDSEGLTPGEDQFRGVVMALDLGILLETADGRAVACNPAAERILGKPCEELLVGTFGERPLSFVHPDGSPLPDDQCPAAIALSTGEPCRDRLLGVQRDEGPRAGSWPGWR